MRLALALLALVVAVEPGWGQSANFTPREEMQAAAALLSIATLSDGRIVVTSDDDAKFADGSVAFKRLGQCRIGLFSANKQTTETFEIWDFSKFTGTYTTTRTLGTYRVNVFGNSPQTRCFQISSSNRGCSDVAFLPSGNLGDFAKEYEMIGKIKASCTSRGEGK